MVLFYRDLKQRDLYLLLGCMKWLRVTSCDAAPLWSNAGPKRFFPGFLCYIFTTIASIIEYTDMGDK